MWFLVLGGVILLATIAGGIAWATLRGGGGGSIESESCKFQTFPDQAAGMSNEERHPATLPKEFKYNSTPATSGPHGATVIVE